MPIQVTAQESAAAAKQDFQQIILPLFKKSCFDCHGMDNQEGGLNLESLLTDRPLVKNRSKWLNIYEQTRNHVMPPEDAAQPQAKERRNLVAWIHKEIFQFDYSKTNHPGNEPTRRLTHREYAHTIRDLFKTELDVFSKFPADMSATSGFDNSANSLFLQPLLMERYIQIAEQVAGHVVNLESARTDSPSNFLQFKPENGLNASLAFRKNLQVFLPRAFRREVKEDEINDYLQLFEKHYSTSRNFVTSSQKVLQAILISPHFLFRIESSPRQDKDIRINDWELANRLSYFLWSSMPDDELFKCAKENKLHHPDILTQQVIRMLADPRSKALGDNFGGQWLGFQHLGTRIRADPIDNPWCTDSLMDAMKQETSMFVRSLIQNNRPARELLLADYTFVNEELARHYRIRGIKGREMRRVPATSQRGGLLGHASILAVTSYPYQTSPVKRGTWILTDLLGTPPPPPPAGASEFDESIEENDRLSFKQKLARHSNDTRCSSCHRQIDPLGFGMESFDWFGRYRSRKIDNRGKLPSGTEFAGLQGLKKVLVQERLDDVAQNLVQKLLSFGLARQLEFYDQKTVQEILAKTKKNDFRLREIIIEIVNSYPFLNKRTN